MRLCHALAFLALLIPAAARADTYQYVFDLGVGVGSGPPLTTLVFDEPTVETSEFAVEASSFLVDVGDVNSVEIDPVGWACPGASGGTVSGSCIKIDYASGPFGIFSGTVIDSVGNYTLNGATFDITDIGPSASPVPEPSSLALLGSGVIGIAGLVRRRFNA